MNRRAFLAGAIGVAASVAVGGIGFAGVRADVLDVINRRRAARDRPALERDRVLSRRSQRHAERMAAEGRLYHSDLRLPADAVWLGEVVGVGGDPPDIVRAWLRSPPHRKVILRRRADVAGVGVARDDGFTWYCLQAADLV